MAEDAEKKNTDCVYFLASPLTCKKGNDCEYRHSEAARMNPRDCWFWLAGNCLNAKCSFRHPPLDRRPTGTPASTIPSTGKPTTVPPPSTGTPVTASIPAAPSTGKPINTTSLTLPLTAKPSVFTATVTKQKVACYFFAQGFCSKGEKCAFLHTSSPTSIAETAPPPKPTVPIIKKGIDSSSNGRLPLKGGGESGQRQKVPEVNPDGKLTQCTDEAVSMMVNTVGNKMTNKVANKVANQECGSSGHPRQGVGSIPPPAARIRQEERHLVLGGDNKARGLAETRPRQSDGILKNAKLVKERVQRDDTPPLVPLRAPPSHYAASTYDSNCDRPIVRKRANSVDRAVDELLIRNKRVMQMEKDLHHADLRNRIAKRRKMEGTPPLIKDGLLGRRQQHQEMDYRQEIPVRDRLGSRPNQQGVVVSYGRMDPKQPYNDIGSNHNIGRETSPRDNVKEHLWARSKDQVAMVSEPASNLVDESKRGPLGRDSSSFTGPKSLAQIKAEKGDTKQGCLDVISTQGLASSGINHRTVPLKSQILRSLESTLTRRERNLSDERKNAVDFPAPKPLGALLKEKGKTSVNLLQKDLVATTTEEAIEEGEFLQRENLPSTNNSSDNGGHGLADVWESNDLSKQMEEASNGVDKGEHEFIMQRSSANNGDHGRIDALKSEDILEERSEEKEMQAENGAAEGEDGSIAMDGNDPQDEAMEDEFYCGMDEDDDEDDDFAKKIGGLFS